MGGQLEDAGSSQDLDQKSGTTDRLAASEIGATQRGLQIC